MSGRFLRVFNPDPDSPPMLIGRLTFGTDVFEWFSDLHWESVQDPESARRLTQWLSHEELLSYDPSSYDHIADKAKRFIGGGDFELLLKPDTTPGRIF